MHTSISDLFAGLWTDYVTITPSAARIHKLLQQHDNNNEIINDICRPSIVNDPRLGRAIIIKGVFLNGRVVLCVYV